MLQIFVVYFAVHEAILAVDLPRILAIIIQHKYLLAAINMKLCSICKRYLTAEF